MTVIFDISPGRIVATKGGVSWFDTDTKTFGLVHGSAIVISGQTVTFPAPTTDNAVFWAGSSLGGSPPQFFECERAYITMVPAEWGPQGIISPEPYTDDLPDILLGTVPAGTDYIDTQVIITRTKDPRGDNTSQAMNTGILDDPVAVIPPTGVVLKLVGQSCPLEETYPLARSFAVVLVGTNVYLRRRQSVGNPSDGFPWATSNSPSQSGRWTWGSVKGAIVQMLATRSLTVVDGSFTEAGFTWQRGGSNYNSQQLPLTDNTDYSSVYSMDFVITPGFINAPSTLQPPATRKAMKLGDFEVIVNAGSWSGTVPASIEDPTRAILLMVAGALQGTKGDKPTAITVNGVAATKLAEELPSNAFAAYVQLWVVALPTGTGNLTISATMSTSTNWTASCLAYALYHFGSLTPQSTAVSNTAGATLSVTATVGGYVFGVMVGGAGSSLSGMDLLGNTSVAGTSTGHGMGCGFEVANSTTETATIDSGIGGKAAILASFA